IAAFTRDLDGLFEKLLLDTDRRRVVREREHQELWLLRARVIEPAQRVHRGFRPFNDRQLDQFATGDGRGERMDRIARVGNYHLVAGFDQRQHQVREALFRADGRNRFGFRIDLDAVTARVPARDFDAQIWDAARGRVAVISRVARGLDQFIDDRV